MTASTNTGTLYASTFGLIGWVYSNFNLQTFNPFQTSTGSLGRCVPSQATFNLQTFKPL
jgi:hypothetical protein